MGPPSSTKPARKRNRKRKRRAASTDSSSSSSSSDSDVPISAAPKITPIAPVETASESSSSSSSSDSESDSDSDAAPPRVNISGTVPNEKTQPYEKKSRPNPPSRSPSPPHMVIPSFLPNKTSVDTTSANAVNAAAEQEKVLKDRFRKFWMASVADGFRDDLDKLRKEPNLTTSRLGLLIDSLAAGADVFTSSSNSNEGINEMDVVLNR